MYSRRTAPVLSQLFCKRKASRMRRAGVQPDVHTHSLVLSELRLCLALEASGWALPEATTDTYPPFLSTPNDDRTLDAGYYRKLHSHEEGYMQNNWLLKEADILFALHAKIVCEVGCGNGIFARAASPFFEKVYAMDWSIPRSATSTAPTNVEFQALDAQESSFPACDLLCSGDVLEHFECHKLDKVLARFSTAAKHQFHVIACYDDTHSHRTVMPPGAWLAAFRKHDQNFALWRVSARRNDPERIECVISNLPSPNK